jgi:hypothetical protein
MSRTASQQTRPFRSKKALDHWMHAMAFIILQRQMRDQRLARLRVYA